MTNVSDMRESSRTYKKQYPKRGSEYLDPKADLTFKPEVGYDNDDVPAELLENKLTSKALSIVEKSAMTEQQLEAYDKFWMSVFDEEAISEGRYLEGRAEGKAEGKVEGRAEEKIENARKMKELGAGFEFIAQVTGLSREES